MAEQERPVDSSNIASSSSGGGAPATGGYWCYQCRKQVNVEPSGGRLICVECRDGFVEPTNSPAMVFTASSSPGGNNSSSRRRPRRRVTSSNSSSNQQQIGPMYPQQLMQVLQMIGRARNEENENNPGGRVRRQEEDEGESDRESRHWESDQEDEEEEEEEEDEELEEDEDEWEEVVDNDEEHEDDNSDDEIPAPQEQVPRRTLRVRANTNPSSNTNRNPQRNPRPLRHYLQEFLQNLVGQHIEVRVEGPEYVGNPGDYLDARGFELLLQQLAETDNSRRGAPPASKSSVGALPLILIKQEHLDDGSAVCAVCKDSVGLGEPARQMPCTHLYHDDCILPWLESRNSCPVCRFELPTDDADYEEQKRNRRNRERSTRGSSPVALVQLVESQQQTDEQEPSSAEIVQDSSGPVVGAAAEVQGGATGENISVIREEPEVGSGNRVRARGTRGSGSGSGSGSRGWFPGPVIGVAGIVLMICLGNHLMGARPRQVQRQHHHHQYQQEFSSQERCLDSVSSSSEANPRRRWWWLPFRRR